MTSNKRTRRTPDEMIADLRAEIERIKARAAEAKIRKDPALKHIASAIRAVDKAMAETQDKATASALGDARATLTSCLELNGAAPVELAKGTLTPKRRRSVERPEPDAVVEYIASHPGSRSEEICSDLGTDAASLRPVLHKLRDEGRLKVEGKARATRYTVKA